MLLLQHREELIHRSYMSALAAKASVNITINESEFDYGTDGRFFSVSKDNDTGKLYDDGIEIPFQLKASKNAKECEGGASCTIDADVYNKLCMRYKPIMLILLVLPRNESEWVTISTGSLILRKCCYWKYFSYKTPKTSNKSNVTVYFEKILTPEVIIEEIEKLRQVEREKTENL
ncbi:MAG: DUF4365 domain-containing protein [Planctomycetaceae bacterium]|jgi:hypothetical protein|nr:DUF4365 domain-containing protein [Planctomycetaceae bacterium]